ncbi:MAG: hypothetical protein AAFQ82_09900 [Myxococcota bacterium]
MKPEELELNPAYVSYWSLDYIVLSKPAVEQLGDLKEDLAQIQLTDTTDELLLDLGWYPEHHPDGQFVVYGVRHQDWDEPIFKGSCGDVDGLRALLKRARKACLDQHG